MNTTNSKGFALLPVLLILILAGAGVWFYVSQKPLPRLIKSPTGTTPPKASVTPNPTADWQTYRNAQYGFEIKYPKNWVLDSHDFDRTAPGIFGPDQNAEHYLQIFPPTFYVDSEHPGGKKVELVLAKAALLRVREQDFTSTRSLGNQMWLIGKSSEGPGIGTPVFSLIQNKTRVFVSAYEFEESDSTVELILSTFKFTK